jgi:hypothetical protein
VKSLHHCYCGNRVVVALTDDVHHYIPVIVETLWQLMSLLIDKESQHAYPCDVCMSLVMRCNLSREFSVGELRSACVLPDQALREAEALCAQVDQELRRCQDDFKVAKEHVQNMEKEIRNIRGSQGARRQAHRGRRTAEMHHEL